MANTLKIKRGTAATIPQGQLAEPLFTTDTYDLYIGKGAGGNQRIQNYIASGTSSQFLKGDGSLDSTVYQATSEKGQNNGYASLDAGGKIPAAQLPSSVIEYKGTWNASTNTPTLADGTGDAGDVYIVSVGGTQNLGSGSITFDAGDWVMYNGSVWQKSTGSNAVASVNGQTGIVVLDTDDISEPVSATNLWFTNARARTAISLTTTGSSGMATYDNITGVLNVPNYSISGLGGVPTSRQLTINGTAYDLSADRSWSVGTVTSVAALTIGTTGTDITSTVATGTTTPVITLNIPTASATNRGALSSSDWNIFNGKVGGSGTQYYIPYFTVTGSTIGNSILRSNAFNQFGINVNPNYFIHADAGASATVAYFTNANTNANGYNLFTLQADHSISIANYGSGISGTTMGYNTASSSVISSNTTSALMMVTSGSYPLVLGTNGSARLTINGSTGATTLTGALSGTSATFSSSVSINSSAVANYDLNIYNTIPRIQLQNPTSGTTTADGLHIYQSGSDSYFINKEAANMYLGTSNGINLTISSTGAATFNSSVTATQLNATTTVAGYAAILTNTNGASDSNGLLVKAGSTSTEYNVRFANQTDTATFFTIKGNGNVGISTASPSFKLHVVGGNFNQAILDNAGEQYTALAFYNNGTTKTDFYYDNTNTAFNIRTRVAGPLIFSTNDTERMRIDNNGNFNYGSNIIQSSNNASYRQAFYGGLSIMWRNEVDWYLNSNHTFSSSNTNVASYTNASGIGRLYVGGGDFYWYTSGSSATAGTAYALTPKFTITNGGVVQIANSSGTNAAIQASERLNVNGTVYSTGYFEISDIRKKDVQNTFYSDNINAISYLWKDKSDDKLHIGYAAQQVQQYIPDAVMIGNDGTLSLDYNQVHTWKIAQLEAKIVELEAKLK